MRRDWELSEASYTALLSSLWNFSGTLMQGCALCTHTSVGRNPLSVEVWMGVVVIFILVSQIGHEVQYRNAILKEVLLVWGDK